MYIVKRGNKFYYAFYVVDTTGRRKRIVRVGGDTKAATEQKALEAYKRETDAIGRWKPGGGGTFEELWDIFIKEYVEIALKPSTIARYKSIGRTHILPALGDMILENIKPRDIQQVINSYVGKMAHSSILNILRVLRRAFRYAIEICEFILRNPAKGVIVPRSDAETKTPHVFDDYEMQCLFEKFPINSKLRLPLALGYYAGLRLGEALALSWQDVDLVNGFIYVHRTMYSKGSYGEIQESPKTASSVRKIPIGKALISELQAARHFQNKQRILYGQLWKNKDKLCCVREDGHYLVENETRWFNAYCKEQFGAGSFHSLRHTHATMLLEAGEDLEIVSKRLGHSNINTTSKIYSHILEQRIKKNRDILDNVFQNFNI